MTLLRRALAFISQEGKRMSNMYCNPDVCPNCQYIGEGDSWCDQIQKIVLSDWRKAE